LSKRLSSGEPQRRQKPRWLPGEDAYQVISSRLDPAEVRNYAARLRKAAPCDLRQIEQWQLRAVTAR
jgi:hypothetical protein